MCRFTSISLLLTALCIAAATGASAQALVAHYQFNENGGTEAADSSDTNSTATLENGVAWDTAVDTSRWYDFGASAVRFDGEDSRITAPDNPAINFGLGSFTISLLIKTTTAETSGTQNTIIIKGTRRNLTPPVGQQIDYPGGLGKRYEIYERDGNLRFAIDSDVQDKRETPNYSVATVFTGEWVHLAAVRDQPAGYLYLYVNGTKAQERTEAITNSIDEPTPLLIGSFWSSWEYGRESFTGAIDDVRLYNDALTQTQIAEMYLEPTPTPTATATPTPSPAGAIHWEIFD